ncbi:MAG: hypothetical protein HY231_23040 [Acidobacteria bacterium]|nr:hypothetical protein [Acidobacteriota bacterium]
MSRLDDELKVLLQRQEPSPDFTARVLARLNAEQPSAPLPSANFWQRLVAYLQLPTRRWALATAALLLTAAIGVVQYQRTKPHGVEPPTASAPNNNSSSDHTSLVASGTTATLPDTTTDITGVEKSVGEKNRDGESSPSVTPVKDEKFKPYHQTNLPYRKAASPSHEDRLAHAPPPSAGELAKAQLMQALFIASATVNEAKRLAINDE